MVLANPVYLDTITIVITILMSQNVEPPTALGYSGPDFEDAHTRELRDSGKLNPVNQHEWLASHSSMRVPTKEMMDNVYKQFIISKDKGIKHFGKYKY
ncbi:MAG: hypothetical protein HWD59_05610 [Coxiellaceae bacterium]|nr:MAG: hypothetical protein HWD59_05610 [Coxiellaceae bacterium]